MPNRFANLVFEQRQLIGRVRLRKRDGLVEMAWRNSALRQGVLITTITARVLGEKRLQKEQLRGISRE